MQINPFSIRGFILILFVLFVGFVPYDPVTIKYSIRFPPCSIVVSGQTTFVYEIDVINNLANTIHLQELLIKNEDGQIIRTLDTTDLKKSFQSNSTNESWEKPSLRAGDHGVIYIEVSPSNDRAPIILDNVISSIDSISGKSFTDHVTSTVRQQKPLVLGPPLQSGQWAAIYNPEWTRGHRRVRFNKDGTDRIPGRFAIDFMKLDDAGRYAKGEENSVVNWYGYGENVLAVSDGVVSSTRNDFKESETMSNHPNYSADMATGNYISLKVDNAHYVFYEHLKPGSILVKRGQIVKKGQVIAKLGFTGQTTGPHLHLHVANFDSPLGAEGLPFVFEKFDLIGTYRDFGVFGKEKWTDINRVVTREHPPSNSVIRFSKN